MAWGTPVSIVWFGSFHPRRVGVNELTSDVPMLIDVSIIFLKFQNSHLPLDLASIIYF